jgi:hypothetical protein
VRVDVFKAARIWKDAVENLSIHAFVECPECDTLEASARLYTSQGQAIGAALFDTLPGGTVDALLCYMLEKRSSLMRVRFEK